MIEESNANDNVCFSYNSNFIKVIENNTWIRYDRITSIEIYNYTYEGYDNFIIIIEHDNMQTKIKNIKDLQSATKIVEDLIHLIENIEYKYI